MTTYSPDFYESIDKGSARSAAIVAPIIDRIVGSKRVIDVGCGTGVWGAAFADLGATVLGIDGAWAPAGVNIPFSAVDLSQPFSVEGDGFDLAVCLEVAEHLPPERAEGFVDDLTQLAPRILFSAAQLGQEGVGHVNCQPPQFWVDLFAAQGYICRDLRSVIWEDLRIESWYRANLLLFSHESDEPVTPSKIEARWPDDMWRPA